MTLSPAAFSVIIAAAGISSLALAIGALARRRGRLEATFAIGHLAFTAESAVVMFLLGTELPSDRAFWLQMQQLAAMTVPVAWSFFVGTLLGPPGQTRTWPWRLAGLALVVTAVVTAIAQVATSAFDVADVEASFYAAHLAKAALAGVVVQLLATVCVLVGLETYLRTSTRESLWRSKYLVLGLATIFVARFYFLSQNLLFDVLFVGDIKANAAILLAGNVAIGASLVRARLREAEVSISRQLLYRSVVIGVVGLYLFGLGLVGWLLSWLEVSENTFWASLIVFVSALAVAAVLLSEDFRWRVKRFITLHFYRGKYDYRDQWITFTKQLSAPLSVETLSRQLLAAVTTAVGAAKGALYVADTGNTKFRLTGSMEWTPEPLVDERSPAVEQLLREQRPVVLDVDRETRAGSALLAMPAGTIALPLRWQHTVIGIMLIGPERRGTAYTLEDVEFLTTVAEQAASVIVTATLSESAARSREFEAFHRLTSFVIHDLKNAISALSMLSQNALAHFDDPEFQRDALTTLSRTVDRMKALLARLTAPPEASELKFELLDLASLALEAVGQAKGDKITLVKDLAATPRVEGDAEAILHVMQNLVTNAIEALNRGGGMITVRTGQENKWAIFAVADTGRGMSEEFIRTSLFAPFRSTKRGGWGIGLYQAKTIVEAHGGRIDVSSKEGDGTTFVVKLPAVSGSTL